jgi:PTS system mannitol-specific IIC component
MAMTPAGNHLGVLLGIFMAAAVSFTVAFFVLRLSKDDATSADLAGAKAKSSEMKSGATQ